ncbi:TPA: PglZ domain-containing protein [Candidatus Poribacteria bacterium]|nr:PglZ domain-containing protein [Candidatus Poribacteria bacterium]
MDIDLIQSYIAFKSPSPRPLLVLIDRSQILPIDGILNILDRNFLIVPYENDLQIRDVLEKYKDNMQDKRFCIVTSKENDENLCIADYIARSNLIEITPQNLLEFSQNGFNWLDNVNQLQGADFWDNIDRLKKFRESISGRISSAECNSIILSALLNFDLLKPLLPTSAIELQRKIDRDERIAELRKKYPKLIEFLEQKVHEAIPLMAKIGTDEELTKFIWLAYSLSQHTENYEILLPRILGDDIWQKYGEIPQDRAKEICEQLIESDSDRALEQIKLVEEWLGQDEEKMRLFKGWLGVSSGNIAKAVEYSVKERCFCVPLKDSLRTIARAMVSSSVSMAVTPQMKDEILKNITKRHLFLQDDTGYMRIKDTFDEFFLLCEFLNLASEIKKKEWWNSRNRLDNIDLWIQDIYPKYISKLEFLRDRIETLNFKCELLLPALMQKLIDEVRQILANLNESFTDLIQKHYPLWVTEIEKPRPVLTVDFISKVFLPLYNRYIKNDDQSAYIIIFDGMRWDEWDFLKPSILQTFHGKLAMEDVIPMLSILPSTTEWARNAIFAGKFPRDFHSTDESELLESALNSYQVAKVQISGEFPGQRDNMMRFLEEKAQIKAVVFSLIDIKIHSTMQNLVTLYEEVQVNFNNTIQPYLQKIPSNSLVFILSDHGFVELAGKGIIAPDRSQADPHRRYIGLRSFTTPDNINSADFVFFSSENIHMPSDEGILKYGFAKQGKFITSLREQESGRIVRYAHGGISMQEMIIPCAVFVPRNEGQLTMF